jgi:hypothetical protein
MKTRTLLLCVLTAWLALEVVLYALLVPETLSMAGFWYASAVLAVLVGVAVTVWLRAGPEKSIEDVLYEVEHPESRQSG